MDQLVDPLDLRPDFLCEEALACVGVLFLSAGQAPGCIVACVCMHMAFLSAVDALVAFLCVDMVFLFVAAGGSPLGFVRQGAGGFLFPFFCGFPVRILLGSGGSFRGGCVFGGGVFFSRSGVFLLGGISVFGGAVFFSGGASLLLAVCIRPVCVRGGAVFRCAAVFRGVAVLRRAVVLCAVYVSGLPGGRFRGLGGGSLCSGSSGGASLLLAVCIRPVCVCVRGAAVFRCAAVFWGVAVLRRAVVLCAVYVSGLPGGRFCGLGGGSLCPGSSGGASLLLAVCIRPVCVCFRGAAVFRCAAVFRGVAVLRCAAVLWGVYVSGVPCGRFRGLGDGSLCSGSSGGGSLLLSVRIRSVRICPGRFRCAAVLRRATIFRCAAVFRVSTVLRRAAVRRAVPVLRVSPGGSRPILLRRVSGFRAAPRFPGSARGRPCAPVPFRVPGVFRSGEPGCHGGVQAAGQHFPVAVGCVYMAVLCQGADKLLLRGVAVLAMGMALVFLQAAGQLLLFPIAALCMLLQAADQLLGIAVCAMPVGCCIPRRFRKGEIPGAFHEHDAEGQQHTEDSLDFLIFLVTTELHLSRPPFHSARISSIS